MSAHQPENWLISDRPWLLIRRGLSLESAPLLQSHLINGPALFQDFSRKILSDRFETEPAMSSLCLIHPRNLRWKIQHFPYNPHKASAQFQLGGTTYCLPVTDPAWLDAFRTMVPGEYPVTACGIAAGLQVLLTISLSDPFKDGYCYKLVAGILPLELDPQSRPAENLDLLDQSTDLANVLPWRKPRHLPAQAGKAWDSAEEEILIREFESDETLSMIARAHGRTAGAIKVRLVRLGKIDF